MTLNVGSQPNFCANGDNKKEKSSNISTAFWTGLGVGQAADLYLNASNTTPNKYLEKIKILKENFNKISQDISAESRDTFEIASNLTENELNGIKNQERNFWHKIFDNRRDEAEGALKNLDGVKVELKQGATELSGENKQVLQSVNSEIENLVQIAKKSANFNEYFSKQRFLKSLEQQKYSLIGGLVATIGVALYERLSKDSKGSSKP